jgi:hypothetical protein
LAGEPGDFNRGVHAAERRAAEGAGEENLGSQERQHGFAGVVIRV